MIISDGVYWRNIIFCCFVHREDWIAAIQKISEGLQVLEEDADMATGGSSVSQKGSKKVVGLELALHYSLFVQDMVRQIGHCMVFLFLCSLLFPVTGKFWILESVRRRNFWKSHFMSRKGHKPSICYQNIEEVGHNSQGNIAKLIQSLLYM